MKKLLQSLFILMLFAVSAVAQERTITGTVTSKADGLPLPGVSVNIKEVPGLGTSTGSDGKYALRVPANGKTLSFSYLGYTLQEITITSTSTVVNAAMTDDATSLTEVVVTAGGL